MGMVESLNHNCEVVASTILLLIVRVVHEFLSLRGNHSFHKGPPSGFENQSSFQSVSTFFCYYFAIYL